MHSLVPQTALRGRSQSANDKLAKSLGYFSIALGVTELVAPRALSNVIGVKGLESVIRTYGGREIATGVAILASHNPEPWIWARVAGDLADIATVATGLKQSNGKANNTVAALAALAGVTVVDMVCASGLNAEKGGRRTAIADYSNRSGFPKGVQAAHGAARKAQLSERVAEPAEQR
jgi:hypothetical protein